MACDMFLTLPGGIQMPALGYGTWQSKETALEEALEAGYRHIDTAQTYETEEMVGNVLKRWFDEDKLTREEVFITTKLSYTTMYPNKVEECLNESLRKLQLEYVDLYLIHFPITIVSTGRDTYGHPSVDYLEIWRKMEDQHLAGKAKFIGVSNFSIKKIERILRNCRVKPANNQIEMHVYLQQKALVDFCTQNEIAVVAYSPLGSRAYNEYLTKLGQPSRKLPDTLNNKTVVSIAKKHSKTSAQVLLRFLLQLGVAPIPKSATPERIRENFDVFDFELDEDDMTALRALEIGNAARICDFKEYGRASFGLRHHQLEYMMKITLYQRQEIQKQISLFKRTFYPRRSPTEKVLKKMACNIFLTLPGGIKMPALGYGTWQVIDNTLEVALNEALEAGYRHIDTASIYQNEEIIGKVLKSWFDAGKLCRKDVFVTTKLNPTTMDPATVEECLQESLRKLQLDYVDLYLIHFPITIAIDENGENYGHPDIDYVDVWKKMEEQYDAGRAKTIGISNFSVKKIDRLLKNCRVKPANHQIEAHVYMQQREIFNFCSKNGITVVAYSPLGSKGYNLFLESRGHQAKKIRDIFTDETILAIAKKHSKTGAQIALRFLLQLGMAPIPKSSTPSRIKENIDIFDFSLDEKDMNTLRGLDLGPAGRVCDFNVFGRLREHPDFEF